MTPEPINVHLSFANIEYNCPYCGWKGSDKDDKLLNLCNKNKSGYTKVICPECGSRHGFTYNYKCDAVAFKLEKP